MSNKEFYEMFPGLIYIILFVWIIYTIVRPPKTKGHNTLTVQSRSGIVPRGGAVIIDRDTHYYKTLRSGSYYLALNDVATTVIGPSEVSQTYTNVFETHDSQYYKLYFRVSYKTENVNAVLDSLSKNRRSIYDIVNCAAQTVFSGLSEQDLSSNNAMWISQELLQKVEYTLEPFFVDVLSCTVLSYSKITDVSFAKTYLFKQHVSRSLFGGTITNDSLSSEVDDNPFSTGKSNRTTKYL